MNVTKLELPWDSKHQMIDVIKLLIYKHNSALLADIPFDEDDLFFDPLLFALFNQKQFRSNDWLDKILNRKAEFFGFEKLILNQHFSVIKNVPNVLHTFFSEYYKGRLIDAAPTYEMTWKQFSKPAEKALKLIETHLADFYQELIFGSNTLLFHDNVKIINFVTKKTQGLLYLNTLPENDEVYFIEEFIHQGSHNFLNIFLHNKPRWFLSEEILDKPMSEITSNEWDYRSFFSMFHGLYTITKRVQCFNLLLKKNVFKGKQKHELLGRMADQAIRFRDGGYNQQIDLNKILTAEAIDLYDSLFQSSQKILKNYKFLLSALDLSNRDIDFRYSEFCQLNPMNTCQELL